MIYLYLIKNWLSLYLIIPLIFLVGWYLSIKLKWLQITAVGQGLKNLFGWNVKADEVDKTKSYNTTKSPGLHKPSSDQNVVTGSISSFAALAAVLGGNLGTGNIAGIAVALSLGGPGALLWMWLMALLGAIVKYVGCYLGVMHRVKHKTYGWLGGPMYYLGKSCMFLGKSRMALGNKPRSAKWYCWFTILAAFTAGNFVQINSATLPLANLAGSGVLAFTGSYGLLLAMVIALFTGAVIIGGVKSFSVISATIVPFMAAVYLGASLVIIGINYQQIIPALQLIWQAAWYGSSAVGLAASPVLGGIAGFAVFDAIRVGFDRGVFATDAGLGLEAILHAQVAADSKQNLAALAHQQSLITMIAPLVVMIICTITGLVLIVTGAWQQPGLESANMCIYAFQRGFGSNIAAYIVIFTMLLFAFTTVLTWEHCAERAIIYLTDAANHEKWLRIFRWLFVLLIPIGVFGKVNFVWTVADITLNLMLLINIFGILLLAKEVNTTTTTTTFETQDPADIFP